MIVLWFQENCASWMRRVAKARGASDWHLHFLAPTTALAGRAERGADVRVPAWAKEPTKQKHRRSSGGLKVLASGLRPSGARKVWTRLSTEVIC